MLINQFFKILKTESREKLSVDIELNPDHPVYKGHFPGNPIAPGVCLIQMVKETMESILGKEFLLVSGSNIKFTAVLNPFQHKFVTLSIDHKLTETNCHEINASITDGEIKFLSLKGQLKELPGHNRA